MSKWQPIETFPKDRMTSFLLWDGLVVGQGCWDRVNNRGWCWIWGVPMEKPPTHWREIPEPPKEPT